MSRRRRLRQLWYSILFAAVAAVLAGTACTGTAPPEAGGAVTPTLVSATTSAPTRGAATATATRQSLPAATATSDPAILTTSGAAVTGQSPPASDAATPDRPFGPRTKDAGCSVRDALPDAACTPGAVFPDATAAQVCGRGYSSSVRSVPAEVSREVYREYRIARRTTGEYEVNHLVPLEAGGSNDIANLWPPEAAEPRPGLIPRTE
jgi:hypothetical protein